MRRLILAAAALLIAAPMQASAQPPANPAAAVTTVGANLNISPKRITFDKNRRSGTVYIYNQGTASATFDISLVDRVMLPDGQIVAATDAGANPAEKPIADRLKSAAHILLVSPRRITLAPGEGQTIRLRVASVPPDATGEYRSHLTITTLPPPNAGLTAEQAAGAAPKELSFQINAIFGISIPAIVRFTNPDVRAAIENARIEYADISANGAPPKRTPIMVFDLARQGASSLFGNIEIHPVGEREAQPLGFARGLGVYPELDERTVRIPLTREPKPGEKLEITFTDDDTAPGKVLAKLDL